RLGQNCRKRHREGAVFGSGRRKRGRVVPSDHIMRRASVATLIAGLLLAAGCGGGGGSSGNDGSGSVAESPPSTTLATAVEQARQNDTPVPQQIVTADNTFGLALFNALNQGATSNVAISP